MAIGQTPGATGKKQLWISVGISKGLAKLKKAAETNPKVRNSALRAFRMYMRRVTTETFMQLSKGGTYRGRTWLPFAPFPDGTPAWGSPGKRGKIKKKGDPDVKQGAAYGKKGKRGRRRPSGKRITQKSNLLRDSGSMFRSAKRLSYQITHNNSRLVMRMPARPYYKLQQEGSPRWASPKGRPYLFFDNPTDFNEFRKITRQKIADYTTRLNSVSSGV
jgi:hypothetical protein